MGTRQAALSLKAESSLPVRVVSGVFGTIYGLIKSSLIIGLFLCCAATFGLLVLLVVRPDLKDEMRTGMLSATVAVSGMDEAGVLAYKDSLIKNALPYLPENLQQNFSGFLSAEKETATETPLPTSTVEEAAPINGGGNELEEDVSVAIVEAATLLNLDPVLLQAIYDADQFNGHQHFSLPQSDHEFIDGLVQKYSDKFQIEQVSHTLKTAIYFHFLQNLFQGRTEYAIMAKHMGVKEFIEQAKGKSLPEDASNYAAAVAKQHSEQQILLQDL